ncbi:MAG TPA: hypothetical protein VHW24_26225 [Bryobacteraceae bacterium]|jgi:hypothetical protein|nr:hypothetical protein [Bryobacteraceae bacterium]
MPINVLNEIVSWPATLPSWPSDGLRKLLLQGELSAEHAREILKMLEAAQGYMETIAC